jgi:modification methylase
VVHLLGIRPLVGKEGDAVAYLQAKLLNRPIFLKHAEPHLGALRAYVYMENKTFINAKMIKEGLAEADPQVRHHYAARFLDFQQKGL